MALEAIIAGLCHKYAPEQLRLHLVDPKGTELAEFESSPHLEGSIGMDADDATELLEAMVQEMEAGTRRSRRSIRRPESRRLQLESGRGERLPWHLLVLDE